MAERHAAHDQIAEAIRVGFSTSFPVMGYHVERRAFGSYQRHDAGFGAVTVAEVRPVDVPAFLADARRHYDGVTFGIYIDDPALDQTLGPALEAAGCVRGAAQVHLAHIGPAPGVHCPPGVALEEMTPATVAEWCVTKLKGFANSEEKPDAEHVPFEAALRWAEVAGAGRFLFARAGREAAAILGLYEAEDVTVFLLATRLPFRNRGIARWLLCQAIAEAHAQGRRAITISCDPDDTPIRLYRRLGFTDEVYWRQHYEPPART
jgi:GNAT superfamily N-acetyltransferase